MRIIDAVREQRKANGQLVKVTLEHLDNRNIEYSSFTGFERIGSLGEFPNRVNEYRKADGTLIEVEILFEDGIRVSYKADKIARVGNL